MKALRTAARPPIARQGMLTLILAALAGTGTPALAGGLLLYEVGTEDMGLAAAGQAARAQDAATVLTNPAGLSRLAGTQVLLGAQVLHSDMKFSNSGSTPALGSHEGGTVIGGNGWFPGGGLYLSHGLTPEVTLGFAAVGNFGTSLEYDRNWIGRYYARKAELIGVSMLPSAAWRVNDQLSVGASLNAMRGSLDSEIAINSIVGPDGSLSMRDTTWGWGANLGVLYQATEATRVGLTYHSQVKLDFSPRAHFKGTGPIVSTLLNQRGLNDSVVDLGLTVPQQLMGSVLHVLDDRLTLLGNLGWQQWSKFGYVDVGLPEAQNPRLLKTDLDFKDTWHVAAGVQYRLSDPWRLNLGVAYDSAFQKGNVSPTLPTNEGWRFGIGGQNQVDPHFSWGVAATYIHGGTGTVNQQALLPVVAGGRGNVVGSFDDIGILYMSANFNWKF